MEVESYEQRLLASANELIGYLIKLGAEPADAKDIAQDALVKILEIDTQIPLENVRGWLYRVGRNLYFNHYKRNKNYTRIIDYLGTELEPLLSVGQHDSSLYAALQQLKEPEAALLVLKYEECLSFEEMAIIVNRPKDSLKTELYRVRKKLQKLLEQEDKRNED